MNMTKQPIKMHSSDSGSFRILRGPEKKSAKIIHVTLAEKISDRFVMQMRPSAYREGKYFDSRGKGYFGWKGIQKLHNRLSLLKAHLLPTWLRTNCLQFVFRKRVELWGKRHKVTTAKWAWSLLDIFKEMTANMWPAKKFLFRLLSALPLKINCSEPFLNKYFPNR